ncbi:MAG: hypothetical protein J6M05_04155 [Cardiobacteriaceae bacterium]|nr:hypothetical protein [Cardiobacteriaceae bacterium]
MQKVYCLTHYRPISTDELDYDCKIVGFFSTKNKAEIALEEHKNLPGFRDFPDNFEIDEYNEKEINSDYQGEGFIVESDIPYWAKDDKPIGKSSIKKGRQVHILVYGVENDMHILGVYTSRHKAQKALERFTNKNYFEGLIKENFSIEKFILNEDNIYK